MQINAYAALKPGNPLEPFEYEVDKLEPTQVLIKVQHCGLCHSDLHMIDNDWNRGSYPLVPGHEIIGEVVDRGDQVTHLDLGTRVGVGWQCDCCHHCEWCDQGEENLCSHNQGVIVDHHGGFADYVVADSKFALPIPEGMDSVNAAPLLCGGVTVYSPLRLYNVQPTMRVGVIGIGGLGHIALQFANAFGCEVTAFTTSPSKVDEAKAMGAHHVIINTDADALASAANSFDFILQTTFADLDWETYMAALRPKGKLCFVGASPKPISIPSRSVIGGSKQLVGSVIGSPSTISEMLHFAHRHNIAAVTERFAMSDVNSALTRLREGKMRYRGVLEV